MTGPAPKTDFSTLLLQPGFPCGGCDELSYSAPGGQVFDTRPHARCQKLGTILLQTEKQAGCGGAEWNYVDEIIATELPPLCPKFPKQHFTLGRDADTPSDPWSAL